MRLFSLCTFVRFETIIWLNIRFNISLQKDFRHFLTATHYGILFMKMFHNVVNFILCCAKEARASIVLNIEWVGICLEKLWKTAALSEVCKTDKKKKTNKTKQKTKNKKNSALWYCLPQMWYLNSKLSSKSQFVPARKHTNLGCGSLQAKRCPNLDSNIRSK